MRSASRARSPWPPCGRPAFVEGAEAALALPGRHRAAQLVGLAGREVGRQDGQLHHLLLEDRHAQRALQRLAHLVAGVVHRLLALRRRR
jgi:hypothetical protein